jgi:hypothetical protein
MKRTLIALIIAAFAFSCNNDNSEKKINAAEVKEFSSPAADSCAEPFLFTDKNGMVFLSWIEKKGKEAALKFSSLQNDRWREPVTIAKGKNWFVNWADYPVIASDGSNGLLAHYLEKSDTAKFTYDVKLAVSADGGKTWGYSFILHDDGKKAEHGFVTIVPYRDGFFACWLDGRKTAMEDNMSHHEGHHGEMTVRAALLDKNGKKLNEWELDGRVCDCCQTTAAVTANGPIVVYRDRTDDEVRDMSIVRFVDGTWTAPQTIYADNWKINACPVNGPRTDAIGNNLAIAWFSMAGKNGEVKIIFSKDGGTTFNKPIRVDEGKPIGRVDVLMLDSATAMVSWMEAASIKAVKVHADGTRESSIMIASSSDKRSSGFPQMTKSGSKIYFAWTDDKEKTIRTAMVNL